MTCGLLNSTLFHRCGFYPPKATYRVGRVLDFPKGPKERPSCGRL